MPSMTPNRRTLVSVKVSDAEKRRVPSKHYSYKIEITWSDQSETVIYRRYSKFFDFQIILLETFPWEGGLKEPSARIIPFLPGKILFRRSHVRDVAIKRLKPIDEYCKALIKLPPRISHCDHVLDFFETKQDDLNPIREDGRRKRKDDQVGRYHSLRIVRRTKSLEIGEISGPLLLEPYIAIAEYKSTQQKELSIAVGQRVEVIEKNENGWWFVSDEEGERGWVPGVYLERPDGSVEDLVTKRAEPGQGEHYVTTHAYTAENADDVSFGAGVIVEVLQKNLEGWWLIRYNGKQGFAPASYLEKSNDRMLGKVEIISSIHDLKHRHSLPANSLTSAALPLHRINNLANRRNSSSSDTEENNIKAAVEPRSPSYVKKEKTVQPPPKRSSVKRTNKKRPDAPPPLPPSASQEPTYEYMTIAQFDANIPDGVSFDEEKKVEVLEKSPGGWWFIKIDGHEGWAPASYIEKREAVKQKAAPPSRPKPPKIQKDNVSNQNTINSTNAPSMHKASSTPNTTSHAGLQKVISLPISQSQCSISPAKRPLPPLPGTGAVSNIQEESDTYEEVDDNKAVKGRPGIKKNPVVPSTTIKNSTGFKKDENHDKNAGPVDFRSVLKSSVAAKRDEIKGKSSVGPSRPSHTPLKPSNDNKPKVVNGVSKNRPGSNSGPKKSSIPPEKPVNNLRKTNVPVKNTAKKPQTTFRTTDNAPKLPPKPKPGVASSNAKPVLRNIPSADDGAITDFRSVLRSAQRKQSDKSKGVGRAHSFNADKVLSTKTKEQQENPPSLPKKPSNLPLKPPVPTKLKGFDEAPDGEESAGPSKTTSKNTRPPWNSAASKPVLKRFQANNNSNAKVPDKKPVFTVGHARIELKNPPDFSQILAKRGSPDGQVDSKFSDSISKENILPVVTPPERKKKMLRTKKVEELAKTLQNKIITDTEPERKEKEPNFCIAISNYSGVEESEISFHCGDKAEILDRAESDWWYVKIGDKIGWAPSSFFRPGNSSDIPEREGYVSADLRNQIGPAHYDAVYSEIDFDEPQLQRDRFPANFIAAADFEADQSSMISLQAGDEVTVTQEADGGWWYAILPDGAGEGWVPSSYLDPAF